MADDFIVNTTTEDYQRYPAIASLTNGGFVVCWESGSDSFWREIRAQVYAGTGAKSGSELLVKVAPANEPVWPSITGLTNGGFLVTWMNQVVTDISFSDIRGQIYSANGIKVGDELLINSTTDYSQRHPAIANLSNGGFVVTWMDDSQSGGDASGEAVRGQIFTSEGAKSGNELLFNTTIQEDQCFPSVTSLPNDDFVVIWQDSSQSDIRGQVFTSTGNKSGNEFLVNTRPAFFQSFPVITGLTNGWFVATWADDTLGGDDISGLAINGQMFTADGTRLGSQFQINTTMEDSQKSPSITGLSNGGFVVTWDDSSQSAGDNSWTSIRGQVFSQTGLKDGAEFLVNTTTAGMQIFSSVTSLTNGGFVVSWMDYSQSGEDTSETAIRARIFNANGTPYDGQQSDTTPPTLVSKSPADDSTGVAVNSNIVLTFNEEVSAGIGTIYLKNVTKTNDTHAWSGREIQVTDNRVTFFGNAMTIDPGDDLSEGDAFEVTFGAGAIKDKAGNSFNGLAAGDFNFVTCKAPVSGDFLVSNPAGWSWSVASSIANLSNGGFVVTWSTLYNDDWEVRGQLFTSNGEKSGNELVVNTTTAGDQWRQTVVGLSNGGFVVTWTDASESGNDTSEWAVRGQVFTSNGTKSGNEFLVNSTTTDMQWRPLVTGLSNGSFVVTWSDNSQSGGDTSGWAVRGQIFAATGEKIGVEFLVNTTTAGTQVLGFITGLSNGGFVVAWSDGSQSGGDISDDAVRGQVFTADGVKSGNEFLVNTTTAGQQCDSSITGLSNGGFVVTWGDRSESGGDISGYSVRGQIFTAEGIKIGNEFLVNTTTSNYQVYQSVAALNNGGFVVAWEDWSESGGDISGKAVRCQVFTADGTKDGNEFLVNSITTGDQSSPSVTGLSNGDFVVSWEDASEGGFAIRARLFNANGTPYGTPDDTFAPVLVSKFPVDDSTGVAANSNIVLTFNETVEAGAGIIFLKNITQSNATGIWSGREIPITDSRVTFSGSTITLDPGGDLTEGNAFEVYFGSGVVKDSAGNSFAGLSGGMLNFETGDVNQPQLVAKSPADESGNVAVNANIILTFNEDVKAGSGEILLKNITQTSISGVWSGRKISVADSRVTFSGNKMTIDPGADLSEANDFEVSFGSGVVKDKTGKNFAGLGTGELNFSTPYPEVEVWGNGIEIFDNDNSTSFADHTAFGELAQGEFGLLRKFTVKNTGPVTLTTKDLSVSQGFKIIEGLSSSITPGASDTFSVLLYSGLAGSKSGQISFTANDRDENPFNFAVSGNVMADSDAPTIITKSPADGMANVPTNSKIQLTFSEPVVAGQGDIKITNLSLSTANEWHGYKIGINDSRVQIDGKILTLDLGQSGLTAGHQFEVTFGAGVVKDKAKNSFVGLGAGELNFTTVSIIAGNDYRADNQTTGVLVLGKSVSSSIEKVNDRDWFKIRLAAQQEVTFDLMGASSKQGTLVDPCIFGIYDSAGTLLENTNDGVTGKDAELSFKASEAGTYFISVGADGTSGTGSYCLYANQLFSLPDVVAPIIVGEISEPGDNFAGNVDASDTLMPIIESDKPIISIEAVGGTELEEGKTYSFLIRRTAGNLSNPTEVKVNWGIESPKVGYASTVDFDNWDNFIETRTVVFGKDIFGKIETEKEVSFTIQPETIKENDEIFSIVLGPSSSVYFDSEKNRIDYTILANDSITAESIFKTEGEEYGDGTVGISDYSNKALINTGLIRAMADFSKAAYCRQDWEDREINDHYYFAESALNELDSQDWEPVTFKNLVPPSSSMVIDYEFKGGFFPVEKEVRNEMNNGFFTNQNAAAYVARCDDALVISFRGTNDNGSNPQDDPNNSIHPDAWDGDWLNMQGHYELFKDLINAVDTYVEKEQINKVYVTGHSLGGAMVMAYMNDKKHAGSKYQAVTFAAPGYELWNSNDIRVLHIEINKDIVPDMKYHKSSTIHVELDAPGGGITDALPINLAYHSMDAYRLVTRSVEANVWDYLIGLTDYMKDKPDNINPEMILSGYFIEGDYAKDGTTELFNIDGLKIDDGSPYPFYYDESTIDSRITDPLGNDFDVYYGANGIDILIGGTDDEVFFGGSGEDRLSGGGGADTFYGGIGEDTLKGEGGNDIFVFDTWDLLNELEWDVISGFDVTEDKIWLDKDVFDRFSGSGSLSSKNFCFSADGTALDEDDYFIFSQTTNHGSVNGSLFYDRDATGTQFSATKIVQIFDIEGTFSNNCLKIIA